MEFITTLKQNTEKSRFRAERGCGETAKAAILRAAPKRFAEQIGRLLNVSDSSITERVEELRFRVGRHVQIVRACGELLLETEPVFTSDEAAAMLAELCDHSVYAHERELANGFIMLRGGVRVGLSGKPVVENGRPIRFTSVSGFNFRIPRQMIGCAEPFMHLFTDGKAPVSAVIAAPPGEGKTTFLRDCARCFSNGIGVSRPFLTAVSDERNELTASRDGVPTLDLGMRTDVIACVPKAAAVPMLVRNMAPEVLITDELLGDEDMSAFLRASACGVAVFASIHAGSEADLLGKHWLYNGSGSFKVFMLKRSLDRFILSETELARKKPC